MKKIGHESLVIELGEKYYYGTSCIYLNSPHKVFK